MRRKTLLVLALSGLMGGFILGLFERDAAAQTPVTYCGAPCEPGDLARGCVTYQSGALVKVPCSCEGGHWVCSYS